MAQARQDQDAERWEFPTLSEEERVLIRTLDGAYMDSVSWVEELDCNRPRQDKSWVARVARDRRRYFSRVRLVTDELERT